MATILIIDDERAIRKTLIEILGFEGYKIEEAADGEEGLKKFQREYEKAKEGGRRNFDFPGCPKQNDSGNKPAF